MKSAPRRVFSSIARSIRLGQNRYRRSHAGLRPPSATFGSVLFVLMLATQFPHGLGAQQCDAELVRRGSGNYPYRERGALCEGLFARPVAGTNLIVASMTASFVAYKTLEWDDTLTVDWPAAEGDRFAVRAVGIRRGLNYQMDARVSTNRLRWPAEVLAEEGIGPADFGVLAWMRSSVGGVEQDVYLPVDVRLDSASLARSFQLVLLPDKTFRSIDVSLAPVRVDGRKGEFVDQDVEGRAPYVAEWPIIVQLRGLGDAGVYFLEIGGEARGGEIAALELWFYYPGEQDRPDDD